MNSTNDPNRRELANDEGCAAGVRTRQCLVVAGDLSHRLLLSQAAQRVGWQTIEAADAAQGLAAASRSVVDLAIVDMEVAGPDENEDSQLQELVQRLADLRRSLVMVCGNHQRPQEEVWARQLGVWIYVPGLDDSVYEDGEDVVALCTHAAELVDAWLAADSEELRREVATDLTANTRDTKEQRPKDQRQSTQE